MVVEMHVGSGKHSMLKRGERRRVVVISLLIVIAKSRLRTVGGTMYMKGDVVRFSPAGVFGKEFNPTVNRGLFAQTYFSIYWDITHPQNQTCGM
jgi:hypothetical protein